MVQWFFKKKKTLTVEVVSIRWYINWNKYSIVDVNMVEYTQGHTNMKNILRVIKRKLLLLLTQ